MRIPFRFGILLFSLIVLISTHAQKIEKADVEESLKRLQRGEVYPADLNGLARAGAKHAMPAMKEQFAILKDDLLRQAIASALVRLGEKDSAYWDFLAANAKTAVEDDAPSPFLLDSNGKIIRGRGQYSPEFTN